jgi:Predicted 3''-5'' exonuclease related to the exonuclease domain of PolB
VTPLLVFDIETIPDTAGFARLHDLPAGIPDGEIAEMALLQRRQTSGSDFLPHYLHRIVAISCALRTGDQFRVWTLGRDGESERDIVQRFYDGIEKYTPQLVSWNGGGFDLPVLHYRGLMHGITAQRYWEWGEDDKEFKWNNYLSRYHTRHLDLMDVLAMYQPRANAPLDELARLCGFPGKLGMDGSQVWNAFQAGKLTDICDYCETDVVNTHLLYLRFEHMRGALTTEAYHGETAKVRAALQALEGGHWQAFLAAWKE